MIELKGFSKQYGKNKVIDECTFSIPGNSVSFFMGPNGSGKTTLVKCIAGLEAYHGEIFIDSCLARQKQDDMLVIWDDCPFYNDMSGLNNLSVMSEKDMKKEEIVSAAAKLLPEDVLKRKVMTYSYGQRKKLALILQTMLNPEILIMDEISNGLDYDSMEQLKDYIKKISENKTVVLTGHQFAFYEGIVEYVYVIKDKAIIDVSEEYSVNDGGLKKIYERYFRDEQNN